MYLLFSVTFCACTKREDKMCSVEMFYLESVSQKEYKQGLEEGNEEETLKDGNKKEATRMGVTKWARKQEKKKQS